MGRAHIESTDHGKNVRNETPGMITISSGCCALGPALPNVPAAATAQLKGTHRYCRVLVLSLTDLIAPAACGTALPLDNSAADVVTCE